MGGNSDRSIQGMRTPSTPFSRRDEAPMDPTCGKHGDLALPPGQRKQTPGRPWGFRIPDHHPARVLLILTAQLHSGRREAGARSGTAAAASAAAAGATAGARGPHAPAHGPDRRLAAAGAARAGGRTPGAAAAASASAAWLSERAGPRPARAPRAACGRPAAAHVAGLGLPGLLPPPPRDPASSRPRRSGSGSGPAPAAGHAGI